jgi:hypothetical protein
MEYENTDGSFLHPGECLVYIKNTQPFGDVNGATQIAIISKSYVIKNTQYYDLKITYDPDGDKLPFPEPMTVTGNNIVSDRSYVHISKKKFYYYSRNSSITGNNFVLTKNKERPIESTSRSALGSGIYGLYELVGSSDDVYEITLNNPYIISDREHGESITVASLHTNRYLDRILSSLNENTTLDKIRLIIEINSHPNLSILWNIVFYRNGNKITQTWLEKILAKYCHDYITNNTLIDSITGDKIFVLPINYIMDELGYDGLLASDAYNNGWDRGCISYNYSKVNILQGSVAKY